MLRIVRKQPVGGTVGSDDGFGVGGSEGSGAGGSDGSSDGAADGEEDGPGVGRGVGAGEPDTVTSDVSDAQAPPSHSMWIVISSSGESAATIVDE